MSIKPKGSPFYIFRHYATFSERKKIQKFQVVFSKKVFSAFWAIDIAPTLDVPVLFLFQLTISLWMVHFLQFSWSTNCHTCNFFWHLAKRLRLFWGLPSRRTWVRVQPWPKIFCAGFFGFVILFFRKFFYCLQRVPLHFFLFCKNMDGQKLPKAPLLHFSALCDLPETKKISKIRIFFQFFPHAGTVEENTWHIEVLLLFLSLKYGADLGRSRLVF